MTVDFEKHRRERENDPNRVKCAHCGALIEARSTRCRKCGVHFRGEAFQFEHESDELAAARVSRLRRLRIAAIVIGLLFLVGVVLYFMG